ncbi:MAG: flp pilus-assembly TadE/G-like family protein [Propionibacteriaceae bacterium]|nr:flp pilus-assembly TadE/G-like family protein [Propionibacteriaceae bacterium]
MTGEERGSGTLLVTVAVVLLAVVASVLLLFGTALTGIQRVRSAADLVAISAASAQAVGEDPCAAALRIATANQVELRECRAAGDLLDFVVTVTIAAAPDSLPGRFGFTARSHAGWVSS